MVLTVTIAPWCVVCLLVPFLILFFGSTAKREKSVCKCVHLLANEKVSEYFGLDNSRSYIVRQIDTYNFVSYCSNVWLILYTGVEYISTNRATTDILEASLFSPFKVLLVWLDESEWFVTDISVVSGSHKIMINPPVQLHSKNEPI